MIKIKVNINIMVVILYVFLVWGSFGFVFRYGVYVCIFFKGILKILSYLEEFFLWRLVINE